MEPLSPEFATAVALHQAGRLPEAERAYRQLLNHVSQAAKAHSALGLLLSSQGRFAEARQHYQQVVERTPNDFLAHKFLGDACSQEGDVAGSAQHYRNAAECRPDAWLWRLRADIVMPVVFESNAAIDACRAQLVERLQAYREAPYGLDVDELAVLGCKPPLSLAYHGRDDRPIKELFASIFAERLPGDLPRTNSGTPRIGFVVTEGNEGVFLRGMAGIVRNLDPRQLQVTIIGAPSAKDKVRAAIGGEVDYLQLSERFSESIEAIRAGRFDLLYHWEIGTDCVNYFLPLFRLAPVQCASWGWPVTSGMTDVDYFISSELLEPPGAEAHYTERLVRMRYLPNYYERSSLPAAKIDRGGLGISDHQHVYFCGQNPRKLHPDFDVLLGRILRSDTNGIATLVQAAKPAMTAELQRRFVKRLPDCVERIRWLPRMTRADYLAWMATADCVLDTPHYSGGANSTYDAFGVGAPVVTLAGEFHRGRYTAAAYQAMEISECTAHSADTYVDIALRLSSDDDFREHVRSRIAERRDVLFENRAAVSELENFFLTAIERTR